MPPTVNHITDEMNDLKVSSELHSELSGLPQDAIIEVSAYFTESWGNRTRIDYGSGMELNFLCWL